MIRNKWNIHATGKHFVLVNHSLSDPMTWHVHFISETNEESVLIPCINSLDVLYSKNSEKDYYINNFKSFGQFFEIMV